ncbi:hypothetical protein HHK36_005513 [Tetracentron sinense]|uniref:Uncharacterized protein n=1 Tax=Tetracentron sinense TaxID=13715 RepID=A0A834ZNF5_TETSI|nr:hypothetical protein HHK36_005513 [Tetracentron sinense]
MVVLQSSLTMSLWVLGFLVLFLLPLSHSDSIHDLLREKGLPAGLLPKEVKSFTLEENGRLEVFLDRPCLTKFDNLVYFESVVRANLSYGQLNGVVGLSQEELFLWLPVIDIIVDDPLSGLILFDIGVAHKQLSLSLFEDPPECKPEDQATPTLTSGFFFVLKSVPNLSVKFIVVLQAYGGRMGRALAIGSAYGARDLSEMETITGEAMVGPNWDWTPTPGLSDEAETGYSIPKPKYDIDRKVPPSEPNPGPPHAF